MFTEYTLCTPVRFPNLFTLFQALVSVRVVFRATSSVPSNKFNLPTCLDIVVILHTHVVSQPASLILASSMISFLRKSLTFPNFHNFRSTVSIFPTKRKKNLRKTNKWINKYISSSFPRNGEAEMLNWRICPDVYVKRFVICKLSIATCSSGGRGRGGRGWTVACLLYFGVVSAPRASFQHATLSLMRRET